MHWFKRQHYFYNTGSWLFVLPVVRLSDVWRQSLFYLLTTAVWYLSVTEQPLKGAGSPLLASAAGRSLHRPFNSCLLANNGNYHNPSRQTRRFWPRPPPHSPVSEARHPACGEICVARPLRNQTLLCVCVIVCALKMKHKSTWSESQSAN